MFSLIKIVVWFVFFFAWLFGKLKGYEIRITVRDCLPFLYFIYLFFVVLPENVQVEKFNFINYLIFFFFIILIYKDLFRGFRYFIILFLNGNKFIEKFDDVKKYLFVKKLEDVSEFLLATVLIGLVYIQINYATPTINLINKSNIELLGFIVGIFSMYGIYIGFLQYLAGDVKLDTYLGKSKVNHLIEKSFCYYLTQSKLFVLMLLTTVVVPIIVKLNTTFIKELTILWQTSYVLLLIIYIFLLSMSLYIIRVALLMKSKDDENLKYNMKKQIQEDYTEKFWFIYCNRDIYLNDFIKNKLNRDFTKLDSNEYEEFVTNIFNLDSFDNRNLYWTISNKIETGFKLTKIQKFYNKFSAWFKIFDYKNKNKKWLEIYEDKNNEDLEQKWKDFYEYFKVFIFSKWDLLKQYQVNFSPEVWQNLIKKDLEIIDNIVKNDNTLALLKIEYPETDEIPCHSDKNIREFLFQLLIDKEEVNLDDILEDIKKEIQKFKKNEDDRYTYDFLKFKLVALLGKYKNENIDLSLPKFRRLSDRNVFQNEQRDDYENSMLYSRFCFDYLVVKGIEEFSQSKIKNLILSMNEEYRLAFMLYQLFHKDLIQQDVNLEFYDTEIKKIMNYDEQYHEYLFKQSKKILVETDISYNTTEHFLDKLWKTRNNIIKNFSWFDQFGTRHQMSELKLLYVQVLLSGKNYSYAKSRLSIERELPLRVSSLLLRKLRMTKKKMLSITDLKWRIQRKKERLSYFCRDYLLLTDRLTTIFTKKSYSHEQNDLQVSVEYLLHSNKINLTNVIENISVTSLLRLEWILRWRYHYYNQESNYTSRTIFDTMTSNTQYYWSGGDKMIEFYIIKIIDNFYDDLYQDSEFISGLKRHLELQLNSLNKTVEEYVELICENVSGMFNISILQKGQIISKLNNILFE